jgi:hypothetical protein
MTKIFESKLTPWTYAATVPTVLRTTQLPLPAAAASVSDPATARPRHDAAYWDTQTQGMDFSGEDRLDTPRFNQILWTGMMGDSVPYPTNRDARNLRRHRKRLLANHKSAAMQPAQTGAPTH